MFVTFVLIFKFILIYLLHVLFVLKIEDTFGKKFNPKVVKGVVFFIYNWRKDGHSSFRSFYCAV